MRQESCSICIDETYLIEINCILIKFFNINSLHIGENEVSQEHSKVR